MLKNVKPLLKKSALGIEISIDQTQGFILIFISEIKFAAIVPCLFCKAMGPNMPWMQILHINPGTNQCNIGKKLHLIEHPFERSKKLSIDFTIDTMMR